MANDKSTNSKFISGSFWMTFGNVASNLLGALYVIPWLNWLRPNDAIANSLFQKDISGMRFFWLSHRLGFQELLQNK
ncbi:hypothetical protein [Xylocopilactobacillus apicola]|uniref:hypothetical protein n=1 Tax=Xylocopilactobacillus apicola TaxID=2932184 RepID=UPI00295318F0|nr:hypothetical protein [Xylocopilactobacillus apicola]